MAKEKRRNERLKSERLRKLKNVCLGLYKDDIEELFCPTMIGFSAVKKTVMPGTMSNVWRSQLEFLCVPSVRTCSCNFCEICFYDTYIIIADIIIT